MVIALKIAGSRVAQQPHVIYHRRDHRQGPAGGFGNFKGDLSGPDQGLGSGAGCRTAGAAVQDSTGDDKNDGKEHEKGTTETPK